MQLAKLEMVGFKSFADKTEFSFEPGITALVGPNGCGKSNVVDAVRWILGEQRARVIRGGEMVDVIFNGTEKRRSMGYAEASLTILNADRKLALDCAEVCVTRRLYRTGESEYFINAQPCRLRDIRALFTDTGIGMDSYSIIEQGKVDQLLQASATDRRALFEEAAGISGYKEQRRQTQAKLERCAQNLLRVTDIIQEKEKRLRAVKYQAAKARRHNECAERLKELAVAFAKRNHGELEIRVKEAQEQIAALDARKTELSDRLGELDKRTIELRDLARRQGEQRSAKEQEIHLVDSQISACEERIRSGKLRAQELDEAADNASRNVGAIVEKIARGQADLQGAEKELTLTEQLVATQTAEAATGAAAAEEAARHVTGLERTIEERGGKIWECLQKSTTVRNQLTQLGSRSQHEEAQRTRLTARYTEAQKELAALDEQRRDLAAELEEVNRRIADRERCASSCRDEAAQLAAELAAVSAEAAQLKTTCTELGSRRDVLREMEVNDAGIQQGVKRLLGRHVSEGETASPMTGVEGMVAEMIEVDTAHATAIEAALGERAQYLVSADSQSAAASLAALRQERSGRAGLIPLERAHASAINAADKASEPGAVGAAVDLIRCSDRIAPVIRSLLGDVLVVQSLDDAMRFSNNGGRDLRIVTLDGEIVEPMRAGGALVGGDRGAAVGLISRRSERRDVERRLSGLTVQAQTLELRRQELLQRSSSIEERRRGVEQELAGERERRRTIESRREMLAEQQKRHNDELTVIKSETQELEESLRSYAEQEATLKEELTHLMRRQAELEAENVAAKEELRARRERAAQLSHELTAIRVALAHGAEKRDGLKQRVVELRHQLEESSSTLDEARRQIEMYRKRRAEAEQQAADGAQKILELRAARSAHETELVEIKSLCDRTLGDAGRADEQMHAVRDQAAELQQQHENLRIREHEDRVRMGDLAERIRKEYELDIAQAPSAAEGLNWEEVQREITELQQKLRMMGPVNLEAIGEQDELEAAILFDTEQRDDLVEAEKSLRDLITRLNNICRERFQQTFDQIRDNFREIFRKVFGGGKADIYLVAKETPEAEVEAVVPQEGAPQEAAAVPVEPQQAQEPDILEAGIEIVACPPGKELKSIRQLSGGEKTMTTIALLFAIFKTKPSPFCILDEVDAALDESNIDRFVSIVGDFLRDSQFIVITHSKRTLSVADVLYGITMEEQGVSKKVAVKLSQAMQMVA